MTNVLDYAEQFAPRWNLTDPSCLCTFEEHVSKCKLLLLDQDATLHHLVSYPTLEKLSEVSAECASRVWKHRDVSPLVLVPTLSHSSHSSHSPHLYYSLERTCYVLAASSTTLCYFLCAPEALKQGFIPHVFVEINLESGTVKRVFARTNRIRSRGFRALRVDKTAISVHVTENTWETTAVRGLTVSKFGETDGVSYRTQPVSPFEIKRVETDGGFMSYKGSWAGGPCLNMREFLTLNECECSESTEDEASVATWELAYLIPVAIFYLAIVVIMVTNAFLYLKRSG